eukprot:scaffold225307_cov14-Tisochrysis_lutea.AAC.1
MLTEVAMRVSKWTAQTRWIAHSLVFLHKIYGHERHTEVNAAAWKCASLIIRGCHVQKAGKEEVCAGQQSALTLARSGGCPFATIVGHPSRRTPHPPLSGLTSELP